MKRLHRLAFSFSLALVCATFSACSRVPAAEAGPLPMGFVDLPKPGQALKDGEQLAGWALSPQGISEVAIFIDGNYVQSATLGTPRPDVANAYPKIPDAGKGGWLANFRAGTLPVGPHELIVQARTRSGATRDLAALPVTIQR